MSKFKELAEAVFKEWNSSCSDDSKTENLDSYKYLTPQLRNILHRYANNNFDDNKFMSKFILQNDFADDDAIRYVISNNPAHFVSDAYSDNGWWNKEIIQATTREARDYLNNLINEM